MGDIDPSQIDEDLEDVEHEPLQWHNDHWDKIEDYESPYVDDEVHEYYKDWLTSHFLRGEESISNETLYGDPLTQHWQQKMVHLRGLDLPSLNSEAVRGVFVQLPLFRDDDLETGGDYQISLNLQRPVDPGQGLVYTSCPEDPVPWEETHVSKPLMKIAYQIPPSPDTIQHQGIAFPIHGILLGKLRVRTDFRRSKEYIEKYNYEIGSSPHTELTDYQVILDAESEAMPLWIICSRRTLQERRERFGYSDARYNLPIFRGLLRSDEGDGLGYDAACILDSVHRLGERLSFQEACDLVQRTRAVVDPGVRDARQAKMEELVGGAVPADS